MIVIMRLTKKRNCELKAKMLIDIPLTLAVVDGGNWLLSTMNSVTVTHVFNRFNAAARISSLLSVSVMAPLPPL